MIRRIVGFRGDAEGDWVAELSCWHSQHIRHRPPFQVGFQFRPDGTPPGELLDVPAGSCQPIPPGVTHRVVAEGPVRLELELLAPAGHWPNV
ncbi:MAG: DUF3565 domain-containing protein [Acidimicrobiales bacterium]